MMLFVELSVILVLIFGIWQFRKPRGARIGNLTAAFALLCAFILILYRHGVLDAGTVISALLAGTVSGYAVAKAVNMIQIPSMVAFQHGAGGVAAFLVSFVELTRGGYALDPASEISGILGLVVGSLTFSGSMIASAKLANKMRQAPHLLPAHNTLLIVNAGIITAIGLMAFHAPPQNIGYWYVAQIVFSACFGILFSIRIGGADMPVLISFLNATAGLAAALCGMVIENRLLIAFGATVAASGSILTHVMCKVMNRSVVRVFLPQLKGLKPVKSNSPPTTFTGPIPLEGKAAPGPMDNFKTAVDIIKSARSVIIIPGYGMALAKAQQEVALLAKEMIGMGKEVKYAIHPVAGRMPGHMNVLLAEAGVDYDMLVEMEIINPEFSATDLVLVIGACDVVNPAAIDVSGTPISGMPILMAHQAKNVICCNFDFKPGYSGVENPLYHKVNTLMLTGDAGETVHQLLVSLTNGAPKKAAGAMAERDLRVEAVDALAYAKNVIIVPGYGMAVSKAQFKVAELAALLMDRGIRVKYAIHPVAGRMPGHMNVILAEAEVDYDDLLEMEAVNGLFENTDVALVIGACDVVNPAAIESEGTPISGMPILAAYKAKKVIVCNFDETPGYSGVANPLYANANAIMLPGDAKASISDLISSLRSKGI